MIFYSNCEIQASGGIRKDDNICYKRDDEDMMTSIVLASGCNTKQYCNSGQNFHNSKSSQNSSSENGEAGDEPYLEKHTQVILHVGGERKDDRYRSNWTIPNKTLCRHSDFFKSLLCQEGHKNSESAHSGEANHIDFRERTENIVTFEYNEGMAQVLTWIESDGTRPIEEDICNSLFDCEDGDGGVAGEALVLAMRAAHYLGVKAVLSRLERFISNEKIIDNENCLSLLGMSYELGTQQLGFVSCMVALQKLNSLEATPDQHDDCSGMMFKDAISLIDAYLPRPYD
mmetsp:Transcript_16053/g.21300  ORF Transcript_16053/g.21300 Transcript_16053/m.21300 type:complete len:286 (-) Transcript_16053:481-1338(-)